MSVFLTGFRILLSGVVAALWLTPGLAQNPEPISIGIIADCQYADIPTSGIRHYSQSDTKLADCVEEMNRHNLDHVFHLGDFIDQQEESFEVVLPIVNRLRAEHTLVLGNHDFSVSDSIKPLVPAKMGLESRYFALRIKGWKFLVVDGNDLSLYAWPTGSPQDKASQKSYEQDFDGKPTWNGGIGKAQLSWIEKELEQSDSMGEPVVLLCHFPLLPADPHVLWNAEEVLEVVCQYSSVVAWFNGHNHAGDYAQHKGIHFITFMGMVDTPESSFAIIHLDPDQITIDGYGREPDQLLTIQTKARK